MIVTLVSLSNLNKQESYKKITQQQGETTPNCMDSILVILVEVRDQIYLNISIAIYIYIYIYINLCNIFRLLYNMYFDVKYYACIMVFNLGKIY